MIQEIDGKKRARLIGSHDSFLLSGFDFVHFGTSLQDVLWKDIIGGISPLKTNVLRKILLGVILVFLPTLSNGQVVPFLMQKKMSLFFLHGVMRMEKSHFFCLAMIVTY